MKTRARVIAFYLPQFHPVEENDYYWGKGFTEWTNVAKAKPLFRGHYQPQIPADLGFYDLRIPEIRAAQAKMALECGVEGFCYWHYWFGNGKKVLEKPLEWVMESQEPNYPFCIGWANHSWSNKTWTKNKTFQKDLLIFEQKYPGEEDYIAHFYDILPMLKDKRYIKVDGKPLFLVYKAEDVPDNNMFISTWQRLAKENGLPGIYFVARICATGQFKLGKFDYLSSIDERYNKAFDWGYDAVNSDTTRYAEIKVEGTLKKIIRAGLARFLGINILYKYDYEKIIKNLYIEQERKENIYPQIIPRFDRTPRAGKNARIYVNATPDSFALSIDMALNIVKDKKPEHKIIFLQSWNEWGEGNYMEPELKYGHGFLDVLRGKIVE